MPVRPANPSDFNVVQALYAELFMHERDQFDSSMNLAFPDSEEGRDFIRDICGNEHGRTGFVFEDDDIIKGFGSLRSMTAHEYSHRNTIKPVQIQTLYVCENYRGQGIGTALISTMHKVAIQNGCTHLRIAVLAGNSSAKKLYEKMLFQAYEVIYEKIL
jgi:GNAT superfamily N-acetyltransferase